MYANEVMAVAIYRHCCLVVFRFGLLLRLEKSETHSIIGDPTDKIQTDWRSVIHVSDRHDDKT